MNHALSPEIAIEALNAYKVYGSEEKASAALGVSRSTFHSRLVRAKQMLDSDVVQSILHEQRFSTLHVSHGTVLVCSDVHCWPGPFSPGQAAFIWFAGHLKPDAIVINGDLFDGSGLSRFPSSNWNQMPTVKQEIEACKLFTQAIVEASPTSKRIIVPGNHDERFNRRLAAEVPEFAGAEGFDLRQAFPEWEWVYRLTVNPEGNGMTDIVHNWAGGIHAGYNNVLRSGINYCTGHTHRNLVRPWADRGGIRYGVETGTLAGKDHPSSYYVAGRPVDWHPGFVLLTYHDGILLRPEQIDIDELGRAVFRGAVGHPPS